MPVCRQHACSLLRSVLALWFRGAGLSGLMGILRDHFGNKSLAMLYLGLPSDRLIGMPALG